MEAQSVGRKRHVNMSADMRREHAYSFGSNRWGCIKWGENVQSCVYNELSG